MAAPPVPNIYLPGSTSGTTVTIEENTNGFCSVDGTIDNNNAGFTGTGFANTNNAVNSGVNWRITTPASGTYTISWRYSNGGGSDRPGRLLINNATSVTSIGFPATTDWTSWSSVSVNVTLPAGTCNIRLEATGSGGLANIDNISVQGNNPVAQGCTTAVTAAATATDPIPVPRATGQKMTALELAKKLLDKGADPNARIAWKEMPMTKGLGTTRNPPNINLGRHYLSFVGSTPFYNAARNGDAPMMKLLVEHGADPKLATTVGVTPLMAAACLDYYEGETPGPLTGVTEAERLEAVKLALDLGNDINAQAHLGDFKMTGTSESMLAHYPDNFEEDLANLGVGDPRWDGFSALHGAVICNQPSILQFLVDRGAKVDIQSRLGWTPLTISKGIFMANSKKEFPAAAKILQKAMADKGIVVASRE